MQDTNFTLRELNDGFIVAINLEAKEGEADTVAAILEDLIAPTMAEPGTRLFLPYRSPSKPRHFFIFELYRDEDGWAAHQATAHFKAAIEKLMPKLDKRERAPFVPYTSLGM